jgi:LysR family glycine cleavage system transcriptional activator
MIAGQLPYLETFAKATELSCFTAAARALNLTQAAVSQRVQALEQALGTSLFQRRGAMPSTGAGTELASRGSDWPCQGPPKEAA